MNGSGGGGGGRMFLEQDTSPCEGHLEVQGEWGHHMVPETVPDTLIWVIP